jgi:hypothetical protein
MNKVIHQIKFKVKKNFFQTVKSEKEIPIMNKLVG